VFLERKYANFAIENQLKARLKFEFVNNSRQLTLNQS